MLRGLLPEPASKAPESSQVILLSVADFVFTAGTRHRLTSDVSDRRQTSTGRPLGIAAYLLKFCSLDDDKHEFH